MALLLGIDLGTSYFKVGLFDETGTLKGLGRVAVNPQVPQPGRSELPVETFWALLRRGLDEALQQAGATAAQIAGVAYSSQANTFLLLDERDVALTPLVLWTDARAASLNAAWRDFTFTEEFGRTTGFNGSSINAAAAKWLWFQRNEPALWARTRRIMTISDYFTFALTGERVGDAGTAALLGLYDLEKRTWWLKALTHYGVADKQFSRPLRPGTFAGKTTTASAALLGLPSGIPVAVGSLDHHVAALGSGLGSVAEVSISTGTVLAALVLTEKVQPQPRCYHGPHFDGTGFYRLAFDPEGAGQLEEYQRAFAPGASIEELIGKAAELLPGSRPAHAPQLNDTAREKAVHVRFILEKIACAHRALLQRLTGDTPAKKIVASGGAARSEVWLQIKADVLGGTVIAQLSPETACLGAAMLAGVAAGVYADPAMAAKAMGHAGKEYLTNPANTALYRNWSPEISGPHP